MGTEFQFGKMEKVLETDGGDGGPAMWTYIIPLNPALKMAQMVNFMLFLFCYNSVLFSSVQSLSCVRLFATPWTAARQASLSITNSQSSPKLMSIQSVMPSSHLSFPFPPALNPSQHQGLFQWVNSFHEMAKNWSLSFSTSPSKEHPGLISFRMDWLDLLAVQRTLKGLLQHHSSKASILWCSAFFTVQLSHP